MRRPRVSGEVSFFLYMPAAYYQKNETPSTPGMLAHTTPVGYLGPARAGRQSRLANIGKPAAYDQKMRLLLPPAAVAAVFLLTGVF